jgi:hypothetical protein
MDRVDYQSLVVQDLVNLHADKELNLNPWYQRRSVWSTSQKSYLINTLFEGKPVPAIYIRHSIDLDRGRSIKEVVDGQQRSRTIIGYYSGDFTARHPEHDTKVRFSQLTPTQKQKFLLTALPVGYLLGATDADVIDIFGRINSVSKSLNAQEKRNANFSGEFKQFCLAYASQKVEFWRQNSIFTANGIARMDEVQFISDVINNMINGLTDLKQPALNRIYGEYDEDFPQQDVIQSRLNQIFQTVGGITPGTIKETIFNRHPLFFSLVMALDESQITQGERAQSAMLEIDEIFQSTENVTDLDEDFKRACTSSTQTLSSRRVRHDYILSKL